MAQGSIRGGGLRDCGLGTEEIRESSELRRPREGELGRAGHQGIIAVTRPSWDQERLSPRELSPLLHLGISAECLLAATPGPFHQSTLLVRPPAQPGLWGSPGGGWALGGEDGAGGHSGTAPEGGRARPPRRRPVVRKLTALPEY